MRNILLGCASVLALGAVSLPAASAAPRQHCDEMGRLGRPLTSADIQKYQEQNGNGPFARGDCDASPTSANAADSGSQSGQKDVNTAQSGDHPNAHGSVPMPGEQIPPPQALSRWEGDQMPFPPMDVSEDGHPNSVRRHAAERNDMGMDEGRSAYDDSARRLMRDGLEEGRAGGHEQLRSAENGAAGAWDGREAMNDFSRGKLHPDRSTSDASNQGQDRVAPDEMAIQGGRPHGYSDQGAAPYSERRGLGTNGETRSEASGYDGWSDQPGSDSAENQVDDTATASAPDERSFDDQSAGQNTARQESPHRLRLARSALERARAVMPDVDFATYQFQTRNGRHQIEITGTDLQTMRSVEVDVGRGGRVMSIATGIPFKSVPDDIRRIIGDRLGGFDVTRTFRSVRPDLDLYYEFEGTSGTGQAATVAIRADGTDLTVHYPERG